MVLYCFILFAKLRNKKEKDVVTHPRHSGLFHLLGEVEVVFGVWAAILILVMAFVSRPEQAIAYLDSRNYAEPLLVFVLMVMAASRPLVSRTLVGYSGRRSRSNAETRTLVGY